MQGLEAMDFQIKSAYATVGHTLPSEASFSCTLPLLMDSDSAKLGTQLACIALKCKADEGGTRGDSEL